MARPGAQTAAQQNRDLGLTRLRRLTTTAAIGGVGLTVAGALVAANTIPGHNLASTGSGTTDSSGSQGSVQAQPGLTGPDQVPVGGSISSPVVISGGS